MIFFFNLIFTGFLCASYWTCYNFLQKALFFPLTPEMHFPFPTQMSALLLQCSGMLAENFGMKNKWIWESTRHCFWHTSPVFPQQPLCAGPRLKLHTTPGKSHLNSFLLEQHYLYTLKISLCFTGPSPAPASREGEFYQSNISKVINKGTACSSTGRCRGLLSSTAKCFSSWWLKVEA